MSESFFSWFVLPVIAAECGAVEETLMEPNATKTKAVTINPAAPLSFKHVMPCAIQRQINTFFRIFTRKHKPRRIAQNSI